MTPPNLITRLIASAAVAATARLVSSYGSQLQGESAAHEMEEASPHAPVQSAPNDPHAFDWLRPATAPAGWRSSTLPSGDAQMAYPRGWKPIRTDPGTVTAALRDG